MIKTVFSLFSLLIISTIAPKSIKSDEYVFGQTTGSDFARIINEAELLENGYDPHFNEVTKKINVYDKDEQPFGCLFVFDDNKGYMLLNNENEIAESSFYEGFSVDILNSKYSSLIYKNKAFYDSEGNFLHCRFDSMLNGGKDLINSKFYWHANETFTTQKTRYVLSEWDCQYATLTDISQATFKNKITWSSLQYGNECGTLAIANLLFTYKENNVVNMVPDNYTTSNALSTAIKPSVSYTDALGVLPTNMTGVNSFFTSSTCYLDYCDVTNGVADTLAVGPMIGLYAASSFENMHYAMLTGKGRSVYTRIFGIPIYTSWDIVNTWADEDDTTDGYLDKKYWIDNQYITYGYVLRYSSTNNTVAL